MAMTDAKPSTPSIKLYAFIMDNSNKITAGNEIALGISCMPKKPLSVNTCKWLENNNNKLANISINSFFLGEVITKSSFKPTIKTSVTAVIKLIPILSESKF